MCPACLLLIQERLIHALQSCFCSKVCDFSIYIYASFNLCTYCIIDWLGSSLVSINLVLSTTTNFLSYIFSKLCKQSLYKLILLIFLINSWSIFFHGLTACQIWIWSMISFSTPVAFSCFNLLTLVDAAEHLIHVSIFSCSSIVFKAL